MGVERLGADIQQEQVKVTEGESAALPEMVRKAKSNSGQGQEEPTNVGLDDCSDQANSETKEVIANGETKEDDVENVNVPKGAVDEWPAPKQIHSFYFIRFRSYEDPQLKGKIERADKEIQKHSQVQFQLSEALNAKRSELRNVTSQLKPLSSQNQQYRAAMDEKKKEMEPLQEALGKLRNGNSAGRERGMNLCSSEEELNELIRRLNYRIQHESNTLVEEKQLLKEIKQLEGTRDKVVANDSMKAKIQDSLGQKDAIEDQVKLIGVGFDEVRKERQVVWVQIRQLEEEKKSIVAEMESLENELKTVTEKRKQAYQTLVDLRKARDESNACFYQNRSLLSAAKELAAKKDITGLRELSCNEVEKFMSQWSSNKAFRDDYERRILVALDSRQLSRDGRMRNPDEKPIIAEASTAAKSGTTMTKMIAKPAKDDVKSSLKQDTVSVHKISDEELGKPVQVDIKGKSKGLEENGHQFEESQKQASKSSEIHAAKLKEIKREEEIAKAKLAVERKKKLAEKAAIKAAVRAQKEAEKRLKEKEKKAKKKAGGAEPVMAAEQTETETTASEVEEVEQKLETAIPDKSKEQREKVRYRKQPKVRDTLPKVTLKKKKSHSYGLWAGVAAAVLALLMIAGFYSLGKN